MQPEQSLHCPHKETLHHLAIQNVPCEDSDKTAQMCRETESSLGDYDSYPKYWARQAFANSVDPDQTPQNAASDQGLHCLPYIQQYVTHIKR